MIALVFALLSALHAGDILFVDLNDSAKEVTACSEGMEAANPNDRITTVSGTVNATTIERIIASKRKQGYNYDTIIVSGHDGSGHFFGPRGNNVLASDLSDVVARQKMKVTGMALWGCYTATANSCANYWMNNISPDIKATLGFPLQSPSNERPQNFEMLKNYCEKRKEIEKAVTDAEMEQALSSFTQINPSASICFQKGICSRSYNEAGQKHGCYHSYDELNRRCSKFDPGSKMLKTFQKYYAASDPRYANPPPDGEHGLTDDLTAQAPQGEIRKLYNKLHLWYHCIGLLIKETGYEMPSPAMVVRLTKFEQLKRNFEAMHGKELKQYNDRLRAMGMDDLVLEPGRMSRRDIVAKTSAAVSRLEGMAYSGNKLVNGVNPYKMLIMAYGFDNSLRNLEPSCTPFSYVHGDSKRKSNCVAEYGRYPEWPPR